MFLSVHPAIQPMSLRLHQQQPFFHQAACVIPNWQLKSSHSSTALLHASKWYPHTFLLCPTSSNPACQSELLNNLLLVCSFLWGRPGSNFSESCLFDFLGGNSWTSYHESNLKASLLPKQSVLPEASHMVCSICRELGGSGSAEGSRRRKHKPFISQKSKNCFGTKMYLFSLFSCCSRLPPLKSHSLVNDLYIPRIPVETQIRCEAS